MGAVELVSQGFLGGNLVGVGAGTKTNKDADFDGFTNGRFSLWFRHNIFTSLFLHGCRLSSRFCRGLGSGRATAGSKDHG